MKNPMPRPRALLALAFAATLVSTVAIAQQATSSPASTDAPRQRLDANGDGVIDKSEAAKAPRLAQQFDLSEEASSSEGLQWLTLTPKADAPANFQMARLGFDGGGLARMQVLDLVGQKTEVSFQGWKRNPAFAAGTFAFTPGKDVDVVGQ